MIKKFVDFIFFSSIFIALCAVAMCIETSLLLHIPFNPPGFYFFVGGASLVQYNLHYLVKTSALASSTRFEWSQKNVRIHIILIGAGLLLMVAGMFSFQLHHFIILFVLGLITFFYSFPVLPLPGKKRIKDFGLLKIITLAMLWTIVTVWFPAAQSYYATTSFFLIFIRRFIFMLVLCLMFDIRDADIDGKENIRTVPVIAGIEKAYLIGYLLLTVFILLSVFQYSQNGSHLELSAMLISAFATLLAIQYTKRDKTDIAYLACIDGMMLLQALLVIMGSI